MIFNKHGPLITFPTEENLGKKKKPTLPPFCVHLYRRTLPLLHAVFLLLVTSYMVKNTILTGFAVSFEPFRTADFRASVFLHIYSVFHGSGGTVVAQPSPRSLPIGQNQIFGIFSLFPIFRHIF